MIEINKEQRENRHEGSDLNACVSCGSPYGKEWSTPDGKALLCPTCATLNGIGCP
ncbi:MAG: hypothetical protein WCG65_05495 [Actinomycetes bacterium]